MLAVNSVSEHPFPIIFFTMHYKFWTFSLFYFCDLFLLFTIVRKYFSFPLGRSFLYREFRSQGPIELEKLEIYAFTSVYWCLFRICPNILLHYYPVKASTFSLYFGICISFWSNSCMAFSIPGGPYICKTLHCRFHLLSNAALSLIFDIYVIAGPRSSATRRQVVAPHCPKYPCFHGLL